MKYFTASLLIVLLTLIVFTYCNQNNLDDEEKKLLRKENELLIKETEISQELSKQKNKGQGTEQRISNGLKTNNLEFLREFEGKYPYEVKLLQNSIIEKRLKSLIGDRFFYLKKTWAVESPMEIINSIFIANACEAHNCNMTNFIIAINMSENIMYVGIREEGKIIIYAESGNNIPEQIHDWSLR